MQEYRTRHEYGEDNVHELRDKLDVAERERDRSVEELREFKSKMNSRTDASIASDKAKNQDISSLKESLLNANKELKNKNKSIESLRSENDASLRQMKDEVSRLKSSMGLTEALLYDTKKRVVELEVEVGIRKESEAKLVDSFATQTNQLEEASILLEKSKVEIAALREKMQVLEEENRQKYETSKEIIERLGNELQIVKDDYDNLSYSAKSSSSEAQASLYDIELLKNELKQAIEAEDNSKKAMDELAIALKEVTSGLYHTKEKLKATEQQLEVVTEEAFNLKKMVKSTEQTFEAIVSELKTERDRLKNTVERLRLEAEESLLAWNEKEIEFVKCIKEAEDEKFALLEENNRLDESMRETEEMNNKLKDDIRKLRDILKQALNEANVAKEAANLARTENSFLKDFLTEKDRALVSLAQENESLRMNEVETNGNMKELKRLIKLAGLKKELIPKSDKAKKESSGDSNDKESKHARKFSFDMNQFWPGTPKSSKDTEEEPENYDDDDAPGGSIFDDLESQVKEKTSPTCSDDEKTLNLESLDEGEHFDDLDLDKSPQGKRKALIKRFGDLLRRKKFSASQGSMTKELPHPQKEITV